ncbi:MAG: hypothetical protein RMK30_09260 [Anaerolineae bacterium]|nr:hypothetical protein [Anaerolineae bacterium]MDW8103051.1 hypothetical protein [Anaerolineae bacterium]
MVNLALTILAAFAGALLLFVLMVILYNWLQSRRQGYPFEAQIEAALLPLIFYGICAAYRLGERAVDEGYERLRGADKKLIADSIYAMLPDKIGNFDLTLVKSIITRERFQQLVQNAFDTFDRFYVEHKAHFDKLFEEWKKTHQPRRLEEASAQATSGFIRP